MMMPDRASRILEVGCGAGALLAFLEERGHKATGVDISYEAVCLAEGKAPESTMLRAEASSLPFADASFDRLASHHLIEHLDDATGALREWRRVLEPGGIMAICTPNRPYPRPHIFDDPTHVHIYDGRDLEEAVREAGFRVDRVFTVFPHLYRDRISVKVGVPLYHAFVHLPYFKDRGRSLMLSARRI